MIKWPELWIVSLHFNQTATNRGSFVLASNKIGERTRGLCVLQLKRPWPMNLASAEDPCDRGHAPRPCFVWIATWTPLVASRRRSLKQTLDAGFTQGSRDFSLGVVARLKGDAAAARAAFTKVRTKLEEELRIHPDNMDLLSDLGLIDAALGRKEEALSEGRRAMELRARALPTAQDPMFGSSTNEASMKTSFAMICAWAGEPDLALEQLEAVTKIPGGPSYGELRLIRCGIPCAAIRAFEKSSPP